jgi:multidrug transporter EmrE-like cation transporter
MLVSAGFVLLQFGLTRDPGLLAVPASIHLLSLAMAIFATVLPTWLVAEAVRRLGANATSLIGSLGPVFTIGLGAVILGEPVHGIQLLGAAFVLAGVTLVTLRPKTGAAPPQDPARRLPWRLLCAPVGRPGARATATPAERRLRQGSDASGSRYGDAHQPGGGFFRMVMVRSSMAR